MERPIGKIRVLEGQRSLRRPEETVDALRLCNHWLEIRTKFVWTELNLKLTPVLARPWLSPSHDSLKNVSKAARMQTSNKRHKTRYTTYSCPTC